MAVIEIARTTRLDGPIQPEGLTGVLYTTENIAHQFVISCTRNGADVALSGTVTGKFIRSADNATVPLTGSISNGKAYVTLNSSCYLYNGHFDLSIFVTENSAVTCVYAAAGHVRRTDGETTVDPSGEITIDVNTLLAAIETATASIPADYSDLLDTIADTFSTDTNYAAGAYAWHSGTLYCFPNGHTAGSWTGTDASAVVLANDLADLKSRMDVLEPTATPSDVGKALKAKTVSGGKVTEYEFGESVTIDATLTQQGEAADAKATGDAIDALSDALIVDTDYTLTAPDTMTVPENMVEQSVDFTITGATENAKIVTNKTTVGSAPHTATNGINRIDIDHGFFANVSGDYLYILFHISTLNASFGLNGAAVGNVYTEQGVDTGGKSITSTGWYYVRTAVGFATGYLSAGTFTMDYLVGIDEGELQTRYPDITWDINAVIANFPANKYGTLGAGETYTPQTIDGSITITHEGTATTYTGPTATATVYPSDVIASTIGAASFTLSKTKTIVSTIDNEEPDENGNITLIDKSLTIEGKAAEAETTGKAISMIENAVMASTEYELTAGESLVIAETVPDQNVSIEISDVTTHLEPVTNVAKQFTLPLVFTSNWLRFNKDGSDSGIDALANITGNAFVWIHFSNLVTNGSFYSNTAVRDEEGNSVSSPISSTGWYAVSGDIVFQFGFSTPRGCTIDKFVAIDSAYLTEHYPDVTWNIDSFVSHFPASLYGDLGFGETASDNVSTGEIEFTHNEDTVTYTDDVVLGVVSGDEIDVIGGKATFKIFTGGSAYVKSVNGVLPDVSGDATVDCTTKEESEIYARAIQVNDKLNLKGFATDEIIANLTPAINDAYIYHTSKVHGLYKDIVCNGDILYYDGADWCTLKLPPSSFDNYQNERVYDVVIVGGGAGGIGAAYALKNSGYRICLIERLDSLGGTHLNAGVNNLLSSPVPDFYRQVIKSVYNSGNYVKINGNHSYGEASEDAFDKLWRGGLISVGGYRQNTYDLNPWAISKKYYDDLESSGVDILLGTSFVSSTVTNGVVENVTVKNNHTGKVEKIWGLYFIDSTSFADVCVYGKTEGTDYYIGTDSRDRFNESAISSDYVANPAVVNTPEADYMYEVTEGTYSAPKCKNTDAFAASQAKWNIPNELGREIRMLSTDGSDRCGRYIFDPSYKRGYDYAMFQADNRTKDHFRKYFGETSEKRYLHKMPMMAFRETNRVVCENMIVQDDLTTLATSSNYATEHYVALASWNIDLHTHTGVNVGDLPTTKDLVGLPYESIIPVAYKNMLVASKCFGASHIAASYFRLTKSVISIGWAAGCAVKLAIDDGYIDDLRDVDIDDLQDAIGIGDLLDEIETYFNLT